MSISGIAGTTLRALPASSEDLQALVDRETLELAVWHRVLLAGAAGDPRERAGLPQGMHGLTALAAALAGVERAFDAAVAALAPEATAEDLTGLSAADRRLAYARWLVVRDVHPAAEGVLALLRGSLGGYPALRTMEDAQRSARTAVLDRTPEVYAAAFLRPAYARRPLPAALTAAERFELSLVATALQRDGYLPVGSRLASVLLLDSSSSRAA
jgi:hypothetical protein